MNVDLQELKSKVEKELKDLEEKRSALQDQLSHVEAVQRFASELGDGNSDSAESGSEPETVSSAKEEVPRREIFGQPFS